MVMMMMMMMMMKMITVITITMTMVTIMMIKEKEKMYKDNREEIGVPQEGLMRKRKKNVAEIKKTGCIKSMSTCRQDINLVGVPRA